MGEATRDPREIITPDAFSVAPELLGTPLARPWRRGAAMGVDLLLIAIISSVGLSWFLLLLAVTILSVRATLRSSRGALRKGARRAVFGSLSVLALIATIIAGLETFSGFEVRVHPFGGDGGGGLGDVDVAGVSIEDVVGISTSAAALKSARSHAELAEAATEFGRRLEDIGVEEEDVRDALEEVAGSIEEPWASAAIETALASLETETPKAVETIDADSLVMVYAGALQSGDSARVGQLRRSLAEVIAADRIESLERRDQRLKRAGDLEGQDARQAVAANPDRGRTGSRQPWSYTKRSKGSRCLPGRRNRSRRWPRMA